MRFEAIERLYLQEGKHRDTGRGKEELAASRMMPVGIASVSASCARCARRASRNYDWLADVTQDSIRTRGLLLT